MSGPPDQLGTVKKYLRSVLLSYKGGIPLRKLAGEYHDTVMEPLPYRELGFPSLEVFLETIPDVVQIGINNDGEIAGFAVATEETQHIQKMVAKQKSSKKTPKYKPKHVIAIRKPKSRGGYHTTSPSTRGGFHPRGRGRGGARGGRGGRGGRGRGYASIPGTGRAAYVPSAASNYPAPNLGFDKYQQPVPTASKQVRSTFGTTAESQPYSAAAAFGSGGREVHKVKKREIYEDSEGHLSVTVQRTPPRPSPPKSLSPDTDFKFGSSYQIPPRFRKKMGMDPSNVTGEESLSSASQPYVPSAQNRPAPKYNPASSRTPSPLYSPPHARSPSPKQTPPSPTHRSASPSQVVSKKYGPPPKRFSVSPTKRRSFSPKYSPNSPEINTEKSPDTEYEQAIHNYCQESGLPSPVYETFKVKVFDGFVSSVTIEGEVYGSYGIYSTKKEAEQSAAKNAVLGLGISAGAGTASSPGHKLASTGSANASVVKSNVVKLLKKKPAGIFKNYLAQVYTEEYGEEPPANLQDLLNGWKDVIREESASVSNLSILFFMSESEEMEVFSSRQISAAKVPLLGAQFTAYLAYIADCQTFYVQREDSAINEVMQQLVQTCSEQCASEPRGIKPGMYCAALCEEDGHWYRAQVLSVMRKSGKLICDIYYIDFGNCETLPSTNVRPLCGSLYDIPVQAIKCRLHKVYPLEKDPWDQATSLLQELEADAVTLEVVGQDGDKIAVLLYSGDTTTPFNISLVQKGLATDVNLVRVTDPDPLTTPLSSEWDVTVSYISKPSDVTIHLIGSDYHVKLNEVEEAIAQLPVRHFRPQEGDVCAAYVEDEESWYRTRVIAVDGDQVQVEYLDYGDTDVISVDKLKMITQELNTLPYQAIPVTLVGLHPHNNNQRVLNQLFDAAMGRTLVASVECNEENQILATLYDTSKDEDININQLVTEVLDIKELAPRLPPMSEIGAGYISYVDESGHVFFQPQGTGLRKMDEWSNVVADMLKQDSGKPQADLFVKSPEEGLLCLAAYESDEEETSWYRARILKIMPGRKVLVNFIDYGNSEVVPYSLIRLLQPIHEDFYQLPPQTVECKLYELPPSGASWNQQVLERLEQLAPMEQMVYIETVKDADTSQKGEAALPLVDILLFEDAEYFSVSKILLEEGVFWEVPGSHGDGELDKLQVETTGTQDVITEEPKEDKKKEEESQEEKVGSGEEEEDNVSDNVDSAIASDSSEDLDSAGDKDELSLCTQMANAVIAGNISKVSGDISGDGSCINPGYASVQSGEKIFVTFVSDPGNFTFFPEKSHEELDKLYQDMADFYTAQDPPRTISDLEKGQVMVGFHDDKQYYRVKVNNIMPENQVSVLFLDYGDFSIMRRTDLHPIEPQFCLLPYQAIKASLAGLNANGENWSSDALARFQDLTLEKILTVCVHHSQPGGAISVTLMGHDQDRGEISIHKVLIDEGHAVTNFLHEEPSESSEVS